MLNQVSQTMLNVKKVPINRMKSQYVLQLTSVIFRLENAVSQTPCSPGTYQLTSGSLRV